MICEDEVADLLPWYITDTLSKDEREKVEFHLKICPICRRSLKDVQWLSESIEKHGLVLTPEHIVPEKLVIYAESKTDLTESEITEIEQHLAQCADCKEELNTLLKVDANLRKVPPSFIGIKGAFEGLFLKPRASRQRTSRERFRDTLGKFFLKPSFAYILVLVLLYPAWLGLYNTILKEETSNIKTIRLKETLTFRGPVHRSEEITILPSDDVIQLTFLLPIVDPTCRYNLDLSLDEDLVLSQKNIKAINNQGNFSVYLAANRLDAGQYQLKVTEMCPGGAHHPEELLFSFKLNKK